MPPSVHPPHYGRMPTPYHQTVFAPRTGPVPGGNLQRSMTRGSSPRTQAPPPTTPQQRSLQRPGVPMEVPPPPPPPFSPQYRPQLQLSPVPRQQPPSSTTTAQHSLDSNSNNSAAFFQSLSLAPVVNVDTGYLNSPVYPPPIVSSGIDNGTPAEQSLNNAG